MLHVYACIVQEHDLRLVVLAGVICLLACKIAFSVFEQARRDDARRILWTVLAAVVAGLGIWATHFIAMLAYEPEIPMGYDLASTLVSIAAAVFVGGIGWLIALKPGRWAAALGGGVVGAGVATMHYIGMGALKVAGLMVWDRSLVWASLVLGMLLAAASFSAIRTGRPRLAPLGPLLLTIAICGLHFTSMSAVTIHPSSAVTVAAHTVDSDTLAVVVTAAISLILLAGFAVITFERRLALVRLADVEKRSELADQILKGAAEREAMAVQLKREADIASAALQHMAQGLSMYDEFDRLVTFNSKYAEVYGIPPGILKEGMPFSQVLDHLIDSGVFGGDTGEHSKVVEPLKRQGGQLEIPIPNGRIIDIQLRPTTSGGWLATHEDVTEARRAAADIAYMASHDSLTGLINRAAFGRELKAAAMSAGPSHGFALLTIDLDRFKEVNDTLGHPYGDRILKGAAGRLRTLAQNDVLTRLGGDEFAILHNNNSDPETAATLASRIIEVLNQPFAIDGHTIVIGASVGIALAPSDSTSGEDLLKMSDLALYRAKEHSRGSFQFFVPAMDERLRERRDIERDLRTAIQEGQFEVYYQPLLDVASGQIECFEALVRWHHPTRGLIQPGDFISIAEDTSLIIPIGEWVLRQACRDAAQWPAEVKVAVNLSPAQFKRGDLISLVMNALAAAGLEPRRLELEITESVLLNDEAWVNSILTRLTEAGVGISLDDFGTGYSSLSYLRSFPFSKIKIDRSFVADLVGATDALAIVQATIRLSEKLGMKTTAEGVETAEQLQILTSEGCAQAQGFLVSRPVPIAQVHRLLAENGSRGEVRLSA